MYVPLSENNTTIDSNVYIVSVLRLLLSPQVSVFYYYSLGGAMFVYRFLRVQKRPMRMYAKVMGQKIIL